MPVRISDGDSVWRLRYDLANWYRGADLCIKFALKCYQTKRTPGLQLKLEEFICRKANPLTWGCVYVPGDTFRFVDDSLLLCEISQPHRTVTEYGLVINKATWNGGVPPGLVIRYRFLQCDCEQDVLVNHWMCNAFGFWVDFMYLQLQE